MTDDKQVAAIRAAFGVWVILGTEAGIILASFNAG